MSAALPRTIRAVDSDQLLLLEEEASRLRFSQRLPADWLREHIQAASAHYLFPVMEHWLAHRPDASPQWRCELLLMVRTGEMERSEARQGVPRHRGVRSRRAA
ncbi:hypothetical protein ACFU90_31190 [Streptomyces noursei]|uniref:hypothetical protein n=1 Tax=Streptomyces noursei TaxID=1971 RepID=UPI00033F68D4|nr:hypothetical protein [Streptomyces noursei]AKA07576.1 hypothetical protein SAZ_38245 [Streptomyces noursei ZPM]EOT03812.1 hypothetical protein K530_11850 [Streptomyces noursei CCRC 11814]EXU89285.1 hypothetical protein P354_23510 [Streptomyces noursei PD-1]UWS76159.1 hypothetical protein N1H47_35940 [Streptomyces noursei]